jgi:hypothetical protein
VKWNPFKFVAELFSVLLLNVLLETLLWISLNLCMARFAGLDVAPGMTLPAATVAPPILLIRICELLKPK